MFEIVEISEIVVMYETETQRQRPRDRETKL